MLTRVVIVPLLAAAFSSAVAAQPADTRQSPIGFSSVATAFEAMKAKPGVSVSVRDGWTVVEDRAKTTV